MKFKRSVLYLLLSGTIQISAMAQSNEDRPVVIEAVDCHGNKLTTCEFIKNKLRLGATTVVSDEKVQDAQLRLSALSDFESVRVHLEKGSDVGKARLVVEVVEASPIVTELTVGAQYISFDNGEFAAGTEHYWHESIAGRLSNQNLFGSHKIASLSLLAHHFSDRDWSGVGGSVSAAYIDPNVLGMDSMFMLVNAKYDQFRQRAESAVDDIDPSTGMLVRNNLALRMEAKTLMTDVIVGYRVWSYSYIFAAYGHEWLESTSEVGSSLTASTQTARHKDELNVFRFGVGWDSEDDRYFPTQGARVSVSAYRASAPAYCINCNEVNWSAAYKQTWSLTPRSIITANLGGDPAGAQDRLQPVLTPYPGDLGITYSRVLVADHSGSMRRGRWYVHLAGGPVELRNEGRVGGHPDQAYIALGIRFESRVFGLVDLYATGSRLWPRVRY